MATDFNETFDFVIAGSGGGSMCAALVLRAAGKSVLILEKTDLVGGTTARSGGVMWLPDNPFMKRDGVADSYEQAARYLEALLGGQGDAPGSTPARRRRYLAESPRMLEFLAGQGVRLTRVAEWPDYYDELPGGSAAGRTVVAELFDINELGPWAKKLRPSFVQIPLPASLEEMLELPALKRSWRVKWLVLKLVWRALLARLTGKRWVAGGAALQGRMLQAALRAGVEIRTDSPVSGLVAEDGAVKGVQTTKDGRPWRVAARLGVLVNAGGFARNQRMRDRYMPGTSVQWSLAAPGDTGEMIEEMMRHGAAVAQMDERVGNQLTIPPGTEDSEIKPTAQAMTAAPHAILVDQDGMRYMNEGGSYMAYAKAMLERHKSVPAVPSWAVFDSQYMAKYMLAGTLPGSSKPQRWYDEGYLKRADSLEELARQLGMEPATLKATVERFNGFVAGNRDEDFHRGERAYDRWLGDYLQQPNPALGSIERAPFHAVPVYPGDVGTYGGVVTDEQARVLREDGSIIRGLYATGVSTASVMGRFYPGAGSSVGPSFVWGYVAARHAAGLASS
ncbi:FAD-dependent oxidoreductase [Solimonas sp. K1W22B-7]|uniref:FAD-dependent oxidoreductase n=1 Tax=Solimonas sp. K1W22B-7 TaxID=2303331 RepID=UPI000E32E319|nr:FAD-dependent oxidoreductase [Solimonas sp. K1W22B-7]AXQ28564.1 FAD-dependent oxidoreductase [Solimonas sp. K1W22B-7]